MNPWTPTCLCPEHDEPHAHGEGCQDGHLLERAEGGHRGRLYPASVFKRALQHELAKRTQK